MINSIAQDNQVVLALEVTMNPILLNQKLELQVSVRPMLTEMSSVDTTKTMLHQLPVQSSTSVLESPRLDTCQAPRVMTKLVQVVQPLTLEFEQRQLQHTVYVCTKVLNTHTAYTIQLQDLHFH